MDDMGGVRYHLVPGFTIFEQVLFMYELKAHGLFSLFQLDITCLMKCTGRTADHGS